MEQQDNHVQKHYLSLWTQIIVGCLLTRRTPVKSKLQVNGEVNGNLQLLMPSCPVLFGFYDQNHDGKISLLELSAAMKVACQTLSEHQLNQLASATMKEFDVDKDGFLNFSEFSALIQKSGLELNV
ncbi:unnamed protein product [Calypogeia fissa]